jgi:hypothetical protein
VRIRESEKEEVIRERWEGRGKKGEVRRER